MVRSTGARGGRAGPLPSAPRLVGRERELAALAGAVERPPAVVLVEGEAGIGKTRLVREFLGSFAAGRQRCLVAVCPPFREPCTLGPVVDALRQATDSVAGLPLSGLAGVLRPLFPEWTLDLPPAPEPLEDAGAARHRLFRALAEVLECLNVSMLVVEDLHWADEATHEFLLFLAARQPPPVSLVVTYRPEDVPGDSLLLRLSSRVSAATTRLRLSLEPLDVAGTAELVSTMLADGHVSVGFAEFLHHRTAGVPLAVEESVRLMHDRADLSLRHGEWVRRRLERIEVPPTVRDAVLERARRLDTDATAVLEAAAVLTEPTTEDTLRAVGALSADQAGTGLTEALRSGLLREDERGMLAFRHALAARAVYDATPTPRRRALHLRAARALERMSPLPLARLAGHFREAGETAEWCRYAEQAADVALAAGDGSTASVLLHDVVINVELPVWHVVRLIEKVPFVTLTGPARFRNMVAALRAALDREKLPPADEARARIMLGRALMSMEEYEAGRTEMQRAIDDLPCDSLWAVRTMTLLAQPRGPASGVEHREWLGRAAQATSAVAATMSPHERLFLTMERCMALLLLGEEEGWTVATCIPQDVSTPILRRGVAVANLNSGTEAMRWGRYAEADRLLALALEQSEQHEYLRLRDIALVMRAQWDYFTGSWVGLAERVDSLVSNEDLQPVTRMEAVQVAGLLAEAIGADPAAEESLRRAHMVTRQHDAPESAMVPTAALARLRLSAGHHDESLALTDWAVGTIAHKDVWVWATDIVPVRTDALVAAARVEEAADLVAAFTHGLRGRNAPAPAAALCLCRAILAQARAREPRDFTHAAGLFAEAAAAWQALPRPYDALRARERQARCRLAAGEDTAGLAMLSDVLGGLSTLGASGTADRVRRTLREHGVDARRPGRGGRPSYGDRLSPRELEVVQLLGDGRTNRQIAEALVVSTRTVESHLHSAMRKLQVSSRTALAVRAVELGLVAGAEDDEGDGARPAQPRRR